MATVHLPRPHGGREAFEQIREGFWALTIGVLVAFAFFAALGAFSFGDSATVTVVVALLAVAWMVHAWNTGRRAADRDPRLTHDRERRGF
jgi:hypothetical protein